MTETGLIRPCREGNRQAQRTVYDQTVGGVYCVLLKMTASPDDAFAPVEDTCVKALTTIGEFDGHSSVAAWLYRAAVNEAVQFLRRTGKAHAKLQAMVPENSTTSDLERTSVVIQDWEGLS